MENQRYLRNYFIIKRSTLQQYGDSLVEIALVVFEATGNQ